MKPILLCSFSGGKTSAYMSAILKRDYSDKYDIRYVFANTGQEREETLEFVQQVDQHFGLGVVWVEAVVHPEKGVGTTHKIVTFETATRDGSLFAAMSAKYGIANRAAPHCTRELKERPIHSYMREITKDTYQTAIGIRLDEPRRFAKGGAWNVVYPLVDWFPTDRQDVETYWEDMPFTLLLRSYEGNCKWCWKKSENKLYRIATEHPEVFAVPLMLEAEYGRASDKLKRDLTAPDEVHFRGRTSAATLLKRAEEWVRNGGMDKPVREREVRSGCSESCEFLPMTPDLFEVAA